MMAPSKPRLDLGAVVYDGDTPADARRAARESSGIVFTNPDMLHTGILPHHASWARTFQNLAYVVVDEIHMYKGVFGSHVANVLRRLLRVAEFHGRSRAWWTTARMTMSPSSGEGWMREGMRVVSRTARRTWKFALNSGKARVSFSGTSILSPIETTALSIVEASLPGPSRGWLTSIVDRGASWSECSAAVARPT